VFYDSPTGATPPATFTLVNGRVTVWVYSASVVDNGQMTAVATTIGSSDPRQNIYFTRPAVAIDSAFYYARYGSGAVDSVDIYYKVKLNMVPDSITLFWPGADADKRVIPGSQMVLSSDSMRVTIVLAQPFASEVTVSSTVNKQGISYNRPNNNPGVLESSSLFAIKERVGPLLMSAQVVERLSSGPGTDTLYLTFSEAVQTSSLTGNALILIKNGATSTLSISAASLSSNRYKLVVTGTSAPRLGDSLRIDATGPIADALGNTANPLNRPVVITQKTIPASIVQAWYLDKNADGIVDAVDIKFTKSVLLADAVVSFTWGAAYADSLSNTLLSYVGTDNLTVEVNVRGAFKTISADSIKTSGNMHVIVGYISNPDAPGEADVADSAAPVIASAKYFPSPLVNGTDTLVVNFSEPVASVSSTTPFKLYSVENQSPYTLNVDLADRPELFTNTASGQFSVTIPAQVVKFPMTGDSIWIDVASGIGDVSSVFQKNPANRRALLTVAPIIYTPHISIVKNPFSIGTTVSDSGITGMGTIIIVPPPLRMADANSLLKSGKISIFDALGNAVITDAPFTLSNYRLYYIWDGRNHNNRYVGSGTYVAVITATQNNGNVTSSKKTIGVKR
jgi:hypothetical protein